MMRLPALYSNASSPLRQGGNERAMKTVHVVRSISFTFLEGYAP